MAMLVSSGSCCAHGAERRKLGSTGGELNPAQHEQRVTNDDAARDLAEFLTGVTPSDLPAQAMDHAAMLIASTLASAAMGSGLESSRIIRDMAGSAAGAPEASIWFESRPQIAGGRRRAGQRGDERRRGLGRQRSAQDRALRHAAGRDRAGRRRAHGSSGEEVLAAIVLGYEAAGRIIDAIGRASARAAFTAAWRRSSRRGRRRAAAASRRGGR